MQAFNARQISLYTHGLEPLFADISCSLSARMTGLIGRNGIAIQDSHIFLMFRPALTRL
ncbi:MAG: hypothetical protein JG763_612 [Shewanella sp.]|nr:hypothetical protein [Shewanella sp.]